MDYQLQKLDQQRNELDKHNEQLRKRAEKFGSAYTPMTLEEFKKFKIKKAAQTGKPQLLEDVLLNEVQDKEQRKKLFNQRKTKFFPDIQVKSQGNFQKKVDVNYAESDVEVRQNAWYLYGVDYMSTQKIRNYFKGHAHFKIEWLNDSACNIVFATQQQAVQAVKPHVQHTAEKNSENQIWYELEPYEVDGIQRQLVCRLATNKDVKNNEKTGRQSEYYKWVLGRKKFTKYIKERARKQQRKLTSEGKYGRKTKGIKREDKIERERKSSNQDSPSDSSSGISQESE